MRIGSQGGLGLARLPLLKGVSHTPRAVSRLLLRLRSLQAASSSLCSRSRPLFSVEGGERRKALVSSLAGNTNHIMSMGGKGVAGEGDGGGAPQFSLSIRDLLLAVQSLSRSKGAAPEETWLESLYQTERLISSCGAVDLQALCGIIRLLRNSAVLQAEARERLQAVVDAAANHVREVCASGDVSANTAAQAALAFGPVWDSSKELCFGLSVHGAPSGLTWEEGETPSVSSLQDTLRDAFVFCVRTSRATPPAVSVFSAALAARVASGFAVLDTEAIRVICRISRTHSPAFTVRQLARVVAAQGVFRQSSEEEVIAFLHEAARRLVERGACASSPASVSVEGFPEGGDGGLSEEGGEMGRAAALSSLSAADLVSVLVAFAKCKVYNEALFLSVASKLKTGAALKEMGPEELVGTAYAFGKFGSSQPVLMDYVCVEARKRLRSLSFGQMSQLLVSLAKTGSSNGPLVKRMATLLKRGVASAAIATAEETMENGPEKGKAVGVTPLLVVSPAFSETTANDVCNFAYGFSRFNVRDEKLFHSLASLILSPQTAHAPLAPNEEARQAPSSDTPGGERRASPWVSTQPPRLFSLSSEGLVHLVCSFAKANVAHDFFLKRLLTQIGHQIERRNFEPKHALDLLIACGR
eukprot:Cvel_29690.t1-p1 / transcript=Cvel_29690.t1 / gene=Cvel_29690 / organism=Chromera_velia_CCMP2878 / gene_product=hypothetical protein / transcript_product=hypothetical protein / location=Cvel_scaffold4110:5269-10823(+) / protein_length=641 / sequence_SO=supercontig / SO=protein_coding / is_pseudo=false